MAMTACGARWDHRLGREEGKTTPEMMTMRRAATVLWTTEKSSSAHSGRIPYLPTAAAPTKAPYRFDNDRLETYNIAALQPEAYGAKVHCEWRALGRDLALDL
jgi:hypothetical protein